MYGDEKISLLTEGEIWGYDGEKQLDVLRQYKTRCALTDLAIVTGAHVSGYKVEGDNSLASRSGGYWTKSPDTHYGDNTTVYGVDEFGVLKRQYIFSRNLAIRPTLKSDLALSDKSLNRVKLYNDVEEIEYGEYPQMIADSEISNILERDYQDGTLKETGKTYTFDSSKFDDYDEKLNPVNYKEYEYNNKKYIRVRVNSEYDGEYFELSDGKEYRDGNLIWISVSPIKWLVDKETSTLVSKKGLLSGIRFMTDTYNGDFDNSEMKKYLDDYMLENMFSKGEKLEKEETYVEENKTENPILVGDGVSRNQSFDQKEIGLEEVLNKSYSKDDLKMSTSEKLSTVVKLASQSNDQNVNVTREFAQSLGSEFSDLFETLYNKNYNSLNSTENDIEQNTKNK